MQLTLAERFRPRQWSEVVAQNEAVQLLRDIQARNGTLGGQAYFITGSSGTGKTVLARLGSESHADDWHIKTALGRELNLSILSSWTDDMRFLPGWAFRVDEAHGMSQPVIEKLLGLLDTGEIPAHVSWWFTTTSEGQKGLFGDHADAHPLLTRCNEIALSRRNLCRPFAEAAVRNCRAAGILNGHPDAHYVKRAEVFLKSKQNSLRALYIAAQNGYLTATDEHN